MFQNIYVLLYFDQINAALVSKRDLFKKKKKKHLNSCVFSIRQYFFKKQASFLKQYKILTTTNVWEYTVYIKSSDLKASKCRLRFSSKIIIIFWFLCLGSVISL